MRRVNVLIVEVYPFGQICGNLRTLSHILDYADQTKVNLHLAVPFDSDFTQWVRNKGIGCYVIQPHQRLLQYGGKWHSSHFLDKFMTMMAAVSFNFKLRSLINKHNIDVIYCNCTRSVLYVVLAARLTFTPLVWYIKGELQNKLLDTISYIFSNKILFFCETNKYDKYPILAKIFQKKIDILPIGLDPQAIMNAENQDKTNIIQELQINNNNINLVTVGRLLRPKGVHYLLEALNLIVPQFPNVMLYILGDPCIKDYQDYFEELKQFVKRNNLEKYVRFTGWREDALAIVSLMDILVHPSLSEGFGRAVLEALALGKPVVATMVGGLREAIKNGENGFLVDPGDSQALANKLSLLIADRGLRQAMGRAAREKVFREFLIHDKVAQMEKIWLDMAGRK